MRDSLLLCVLMWRKPEWAPHWRDVYMRTSLYVSNHIMYYCKSTLCESCSCHQWI